MISTSISVPSLHRMTQSRVWTSPFSKPESDSARRGSSSGAQHLGELLADQLAGLEPQQAMAAGVDLQVDAVRGRNEDPVGGLFDHRTKVFVEPTSRTTICVKGTTRPALVEDIERGRMRPPG